MIALFCSLPNLVKQDGKLQKTPQISTVVHDVVSGFILIFGLLANAIFFFDIV